MKRRRIALLAAADVAVIALAAMAWARFNGFSTRTPPMMAERLLARAVRREAVPRTARDARNPVAFSPEVWADARAHFADHCATCHGNDGGGRTEIGQNLYPRAPDMRLADTQSLTDGELYWIIENGVRLTGMPAWGDGSDHDVDTWNLVHFVRHLKELTVEQLDEMATLNPKSPSELKEEQEDQRFLSGQSVETPTETPHQHHSGEP